MRYDNNAIIGYRIDPDENYYQDPEGGGGGGSGPIYPNPVPLPPAPMVYTIYAGELAGRKILVVGTVPVYSAPADVAKTTEVLPVASLHTITGYIDGDPNVSTAPIYLVVKDESGTERIIEKNDFVSSGYQLQEPGSAVTIPSWVWLAGGVGLFMYLFARNKKR
jgi:hypothetical protein